MAKATVRTNKTLREVEAKEITLRLLDDLLGGLSEDVGVRLWDGTLWPEATPRRTTIVLKHPGALRAMFLPPTEMNVAESYLYDDYDVEGRLEDIFGVVREPREDKPSNVQKASAALQLVGLPRKARERKGGWSGAVNLSGKAHTRERDKEAVAYHYNASNDFYKLFLDPRMVYSCAYFQNEDDSLEQAQIQKLDYICKKLNLQPGQKLLDIGCGWGGLIIHAVENFGVEATGVTLSQSQYEYAKAAIEAKGLGDRCRVLLRDYRDTENIGGEGNFDAISSVEMFEHVGTKNLPVFFGEAMKLLKPRGPMFIQGSCRGPLPPTKGPSFVQKYVFPDGELIPIPTVLEAAEGAGLEVRDVESLREHFTLTLRHWVRNLEDAHDAAMEFVNEPTYRVWRLYMAVSMYGFISRRVNLYQAVMVKPDHLGASGFPATRHPWYCD